MSGLVLERALLGRAIAKLSRSKRRIVLLHDVEGLTHKEVARRLGLAVSTSKSQLSRAHLLLRKVFGGAKKGYKRRHFEECTNSGHGA
jgi:RNA polymerase sigma-70 factor (ECF subfamily)